MPQIVRADQPRLLRGLNFLSGESMFELKPIARHLLLACGGLAGALLIASPASAQQAQGQEQKAYFCLTSGEKPNSE